MLGFAKFLNVIAFPNKRGALHCASHYTIFFLLIPQPMFIELMPDEACTKKLFIPIFITFNERLDKSERLSGIERDRLSPITNSFVLRQIDPVKGVILTNKEISKLACFIRHETTSPGIRRLTIREASRYVATPQHA